MKDYHAADHVLTGYLRDLSQAVETAERRDVIYREPDFRLTYDPAVNWRSYQSVAEQEAIAAAEWRRMWVEAFATSMFGIIGLVAFAVFIFFPL